MERYSLFSCSARLACPHLRWHDKMGLWIAKKADPCPTCKRLDCHNKGKPFHAPRKLKIL